MKKYLLIHHHGRNNRHRKSANYPIPMSEELYTFLQGITKDLEKYEQNIDNESDIEYEYRDAA